MQGSLVLSIWALLGVLSFAPLWDLPSRMLTLWKWQPDSRAVITAETGLDMYKTNKLYNHIFLENLIHGCCIVYLKVHIPSPLISYPWKHVTLTTHWAFSLLFLQCTYCLLNVWRYRWVDWNLEGNQIVSLRTQQLPTAPPLRSDNEGLMQPRLLYAVVQLT